MPCLRRNEFHAKHLIVVGALENLWKFGCEDGEGVLGGQVRPIDV